MPVGGQDDGTGAAAAAEEGLQGRLRVAVIGGGLTGLLSARWLKKRGVDVVLYEASSEVGGIWNHVHATSNLQLPGSLYQMRVGTTYATDFPYRDEILRELHACVDEVNLRPHIRLNHRVERVERLGEGRWRVDGECFDGVIAATGLEQSARQLRFAKQELFKGTVVTGYNCDLDALAQKHVVVVGCGATAIEMTRTAYQRGATHVTLLARSAHWVVPGYLMLLGIFHPWLTDDKYWYNRGARLLLTAKYQFEEMAGMIPDAGEVYDGPRAGIQSPLFFDMSHDSRVTYRVGEIAECSTFSVTLQDGAVIPADVVVTCVGWKPPDFAWLPEEARPDESLLVGMLGNPVRDPTIVYAGYAVGNGTYANGMSNLPARMLYMFLRDPATRPSAAEYSDGEIGFERTGDGGCWVPSMTYAWRAMRKFMALKKARHVWEEDFSGAKGWGLLGRCCAGWDWARCWRNREPWWAKLCMPRISPWKLE